MPFIVYEAEDCDWMRVWIKWETTLPQVIIKGFNLCEKKNSYFLGSKGLTRDYLPYYSTIWDLKQHMYIVSKVCSKTHCMDCGIVFVILPLKAQIFWLRVEYHKKESSLNIVNTNELIQDKHMQWIN